MANNNDKAQKGQAVKTQQSNVTVEGDAPQQSAVPAAGVVEQKSAVPATGVVEEQKSTVSAGQSSDSTNNTRRRGYIVISSIILVLSILCVAASIYLYLHQMHAMILNPKTIYCIVGAGALALCCGVLSLWKLIAECKKGKDSPDVSAVASSATAAESRVSVDSTGSEASVASTRSAETDRGIKELSENIQKLSLDMKETKEVIQIMERRLMTLLSENDIAEKCSTFLKAALQKLEVGDFDELSSSAAPGTEVKVRDAVVGSGGAKATTVAA
ncbi:hypothetical protein [Anaplasma phagocytophilum]|uniref:hypothetical protein n=1 Tax=Anaplasma phagocytophilum TaxID=948 RepID=UPI00035B9C79|nr:hypothetical protein [Anaplasma phagocytophilum]AGR80697.1 hypothetical protein WSQ_03400 [Anaplasma phagocytophilum str. JM]KJV60681.1 hypothetical protein APHWEB_1297 [Anaplasma phagocytophilum str. Webster]PLC10589.1 hypothetical protein C0V68_00205 [Anaplasma phagocytophilum]